MDKLLNTKLTSFQSVEVSDFRTGHETKFHSQQTNKQQSQSRITVPEGNVLVSKVSEANVPDCSYKVVGQDHVGGFFPI